MWFFRRKTEENVNVTFEKRLKQCENDILGLTTDMEVMRNNVLRKLQTKRKPVQEEPPQYKPFGGILTPEEAKRFNNELE